MNKEEFQRLIHEFYQFNADERKCIIEVIDQLGNVVGKRGTNDELANKCKEVYQILYGKEPFKEFVQILKKEKKMGAFPNTVY